MASVDSRAAVMEPVFRHRRVRPVSTSQVLDAAALETLGVYDPASEHAELQLELLQYLLGLGATADDLVANRDRLPGLR